MWMQRPPLTRWWRRGSDAPNRAGLRGKKKRVTTSDKGSAEEGDKAIVPNAGITTTTEGRRRDRMLRREEKGVGVHSSAIPPSLLSTVVCKLLAGGNKSWQAGRGEEGQNGWWLSDPFPLPYSLIGTIKKTCKLCCLPPLFALSKTSIFIVPPATELLKGGPAATVTDRPPRTVQNSYAPRSLRSVARSAFSSSYFRNTRSQRRQRLSRFS